jgi:hypothetical protein
MAVINLSNQHISASYQNLVQISSSNALYNGTGSLITNLTVTASYATTASFVSTLNQAVQISGSLTVTGSTTLNNLMTLVPRTTTPLQATTVTGSVMISGSSASSLNMYVYLGTGSLGTGWSKITTT